MSEAVVNNTKDFIIDKNGVLVEYIGNDPIVRIPDGVKKIDKKAFVKTQVEELIVPGNLSPQQLFLPSIRRITFLEGTTFIPMSIFNDNIELI